MEKDIQLSCLAAVTDNDLIQKIQEQGDNDAYLELRARYEKAYYSMCHKYLKACVTLGLKEEDILDNMDFVLFNSARSFDFSRKIKFSTWISNQARYFCLNSMRRGKRNMNNFNNCINTSEMNEDENHTLEAAISKDYRTNHNVDNLEEVKYLFNNVSDPQAKQILELRYQNRRKTSWEKISKQLNINYNLCKSLHDNAIENFRTRMNISPVYSVS